MDLYKLLLVTFWAIVFWKGVHADDSWEPYRFMELIDRDLIKLSAKVGQQSYTDLDDRKLKFDHDFTLDDSETIQVLERDPQWNEKMSYFRNKIKEARIRQRKIYYEIEAHTAQNEVRKLRSIIDLDDEEIQYFVELCTNLENESEPKPESSSGPDSQGIFSDLTSWLVFLMVSMLFIH